MTAQAQAFQLSHDRDEQRRVDIDNMVNRFLGWRLPQDFSPDAGVSFVRPSNPAWWPTGTNLFSADQAKALFEYVAGTGYAHQPSAVNDRVHCACGDAYPATGYDAGFIHGSGMCQNCDAAIPAKDIASAAAGQLTDTEISSDIKQYNLNTVSGALLLACDLIEDLIEGKQLSAQEIEFVGHCRELAEGAYQ